MTAFNGRLKPKRVMGLPAYSLLFMSMALPCFVLALLIQIVFLSTVLFVMSGLFVFLSIFFFVLGDDAPFFHVFFLAKAENNNVTIETWTRE
ncbi:MAG: hypothetical protein GY941_30215 [Planctomycetes bacterium]|nr:hypothetical protein [Planctomycetota bacterium]